MMINKKLGLLAAAILSASSANAFFEQGNAIFVGFAASSSSGGYDATMVDLGMNAANIGSLTSENVGAGFDQWTVLGAVDDQSGAVSGGSFFNPTNFYPNDGMLSAGTSGSANSNSLLRLNKTSLNAWISDLQSIDLSDADGVNGSVTLASGNGDTYKLGYQGWGKTDSALAPDVASTLSFVLESTNDLNDAALISNAATLISYDSTAGTVSAVPVPAAAWLFGSALAGLTAIRRRK